VKSLFSLPQGHGHGGHYFFETSMMLITFVSLGKFMESRVKGETSRALTVLASLQPKSALLVDPDTEEEREIDLALVKANDLLRVRPGASLPTDGIVIEGESYVDESMLTGEVMPVHKGPQDGLMGGTINQNGTFIMRATSVGLQVSNSSTSVD
jgi:P-type E1-E2 ATPase